MQDAEIEFALRRELEDEPLPPKKLNTEPE